MSMLTRFNPFRPPARFDPVAEFEDLFRNLASRPLLRDLDAAPEMRMDVQEDDAGYRVSLDVPGASREDIEVTIEGNQVTVQAELKGERTQEDRRHLYTERYTGRTFRSFGLPQEIDRDRCEAQYDNGVLKLTLPKKADGRATKLAIH